MEKIKIKYHTDEIEKLRYIDGKSDWIDLRAAEDVELKQGDFRLISLGISMQFWFFEPRHFNEISLCESIYLPSTLPVP